MSSDPPSLVTRLRSEKTRPKTSFSSSPWERPLRAGAGASPLLVMLEPDGGRPVFALDEVGRGVQRRE